MALYLGDETLPWKITHLQNLHDHLSLMTTGIFRVLDVTTAVVESRWQATLPYAFLGVNFHFRFRLNLHHQLKMLLRKKKMLDHVGSISIPFPAAKWEIHTRFGAPIARLEAPDGSSCNATCVPTDGLSCRDIRGTDRVSCQLRSLVDTNGVWLGQRTHRKRAGNGLKSGGELLFFFWGVVAMVDCWAFAIWIMKSLSNSPLWNQEQPRRWDE